jgi:hypothetical protein
MTNFLGVPIGKIGNLIPRLRIARFMPAPLNVFDADFSCPVPNSVRPRANISRFRIIDAKTEHLFSWGCGCGALEF